MTKTLIAITTYMKSDGLVKLLTSLVKHNYHLSNKILVCDDNAGKDYLITKKDNPDHPHWRVEISGEVLGIDYTIVDPAEMPSAEKAVKTWLGVIRAPVDIEVISGKARGGVAINKNRGIKYFLEHPEFDELLMLDDDIVMTGPGLLEACRATGEPHMTGMLGQNSAQAASFGADACPFFDSFPKMGETPTHIYAGGSMGCMLYFTRECIQRVGYMETLSKDGKYGFEHSIFSNRINALYGKYIDWFPILKGCDRFFVSQEIPNNYTADYSQNQRGWAKRKPEIFKGVNLTIKNPGC